MCSARATEASSRRAWHPDLAWLAGASSVLAWGALLTGAVLGRPYGLCQGTPGSTGWLFELPAASPLLFSGPLTQRAAPALATLLLMLVAMMGPLLLQPLLHVRQGAFAARRGRAALLFLVGYAAVWMPAGIMLQRGARHVSLAVGAFGLPLAILLAGLWQACPWKQRALNACHRLPALAAFGWRAERQALGFGLRHGLACLGACWALMLLPMLAGRAHLAVMAVVALLQLAERQERPARARWAWHVPLRLYRQARFALEDWGRACLAAITSG